MDEDRDDTGVENGEDSYQMLDGGDDEEDARGGKKASPPGPWKETPRTMIRTATIVMKTPENDETIQVPHEALVGGKTATAQKKQKPRTLAAMPKESPRTLIRAYAQTGECFFCLFVCLFVFPLSRKPHSPLISPPTKL